MIGRNIFFKYRSIIKFIRLYFLIPEDYLFPSFLISESYLFYIYIVQVVNAENKSRKEKPQLNTK